MYPFRKCKTVWKVRLKWTSKLNVWNLFLLPKQNTTLSRNATTNTRFRLRTCQLTTEMCFSELTPEVPRQKLPLWERTEPFSIPSIIIMTEILWEQPFGLSRIFTSSFRKVFKLYIPAPPVTEKRLLKLPFFWMKGKLRLYLTTMPLLSLNPM